MSPYSHGKYLRGERRSISRGWIGLWWVIGGTSLIPMILCGSIEMGRCIHEASVPREVSNSPRSIDVEFEEGGQYDVWVDCLDFCTNLRARGGPYMDWDGVPYSMYNDEN
jgi:hypothetical protein